MLVLSRKKNESIIIGDGLITLVVVEIRGDKVRLGIEAPKDISVHRAEVQRAIEAAASGPKELVILDEIELTPSEEKMLKKSPHVRTLHLPDNLIPAGSPLLSRVAKLKEAK